MISSAHFEGKVRKEMDCVDLGEVDQMDECQFSYNRCIQTS